MTPTSYEAAKGSNRNSARPFVVLTVWSNGLRQERRGDFATLEAAEKKAAKLRKALQA